MHRYYNKVELLKALTFEDIVKIIESIQIILLVLILSIATKSILLIN